MDEDPIAAREHRRPAEAREEMVTFRAADATDSDMVARLHAESWRRHYRFAYPPEFFGPTLDDDRATTWRTRLASDLKTRTILAEIDGEIAGFVHVVLNEDSQWGSLVDNLHVRHDRQRHGVGAALLGRAGSVIEGEGGSMYLWVLEENRRARAFYAALGAQEVETRPASPPALSGITKIRCAWSTIDHLPQAEPN